jgi:hypothetical protein
MLADKAGGGGDRIVDDRPSEQRAGMRLGPGHPDIRSLGERRTATDTKLAMGVGIMVAGGNVRRGRRCGGLAGKTERKQPGAVGTAHLHGSRQQRREHGLERQGIGRNPDDHPSGLEAPPRLSRKWAHV